MLRVWLLLVPHTASGCSRRTPDLWLRRLGHGMKDGLWRQYRGCEGFVGAVLSDSEMQDGHWW